MQYTLWTGKFSRVVSKKQLEPHVLTLALTHPEYNPKDVYTIAENEAVYPIVACKFSPPYRIDSRDAEE